MSNITPLRDYSTRQIDAAYVSQLGVDVMALAEIPAEDLAGLVVDSGGDMIIAYDILSASAKRILNILHRIEVYAQAKALTDDLIKNGRMRP